MKILGIETSCDETAAALIEVKAGRFQVLSNIVSSQVDIHRQFGGIVPEVAAREHLKNILPIVDQALIGNSWSDLSALAVTSGPGLITSLLVGTETAKALAFSHSLPLLAINHLEAHICANWLNRPIRFPALALIVSGGHTQLVLVKKQNQYQLVGETLDDAAGECFDKVAKILDIGYPGGPVIEKLAKEGDPQAIDFPRPLLNKNGLDFSFSGLKTSVLYFSRQPDFKEYKTKDVCASFQQAVIEVLTAKTLKAAKRYRAKTVLLAGGVAANKALRQNLASQVKKQLPSSKFFHPAKGLSTDNALMIAIAGYYRFREKNFTPWAKLKADPNWQLA